MSLTEYHRRAIDIRHRLRNPANAVPDAGIEMRNGWPVRMPPVPATIEIAKPEELPQEVVIAQRVPRLLGRPFAITDIIELVSATYNVAAIDLVSSRRTLAVVIPRQIAMWLARHLTTRSLPEIGRRFGNRDHTTVLHACRKIDRLRKEDPELEHQLIQFMSVLRPLHSENSDAEYTTISFRD